ncbi:hypothetical protein [Streptomyces sp. NPDC057403]|uniref:hypothetical protein n=1 Tax=Streptomyces sp. NPDC057403 TaxID=3346119 RepID=UPI0036A77A79
MTPLRRRAALDRARRRLDTPAPTVPGQLTAPVEADRAARPAVQLAIFTEAGGAYWNAWRT